MKCLTYILIFYFSLGACIPNCDFSQLWKLNDLMEHFELHQEEAQAAGETINFSEFLYSHFIDGDDDHDHEEEDNHENLPFQTIASSIVLCVDSNQEMPSTFKYGLSETALPIYSSILLAGFTFDIFHPPTIA